MPKPLVKSVTVRFRAFPKDLAVWKRLSRADAKTLSNWIRDSLNTRRAESSPQPTAGRDRRELP